MTLLSLWACATVAAQVATSTTAVLPQKTVATAYSTTGYIIKTVKASGGNYAATATGLNSALSFAAANCGAKGVLILMDAGLNIASATGYTLPPTNCSSGKKIVVSSAAASLPAVGVRATPVDAAFMPKLRTTAGVNLFQFASNSDNWRFVGIELVAGASTRSSLVLLGSSQETAAANLPNNVLFDRVYIHPLTENLTLRRGIQLNCTNCGIINSWIAGAHEVGADSQAVASINGAGPFIVSNNYLEGAAENIMLGGSTSAANVLASDVTITRNHILKPLWWDRHHPDFAGIGWSVKNLIECKGGVRVLVEDNILANNWVGADQRGYSVMFTPRATPGNGNPDTTCADWTFRWLHLKNTNGGFSLAGEDSNEAPPRPLRGYRVTVQQVLIAGVTENDAGAGFCLRGASNFEWMRFDHVTCPAAVNAFVTLDASSPPRKGFTLTNGVFAAGALGLVAKPPGDQGDSGLNNVYGAGNWTMSRNVIMNPGSASVATVGTGETFATNTASGFCTSTGTYTGRCYPPDFSDVVDIANCDGGIFAIAACGFESSSPYKTGAADGSPLGVDTATLASRLNRVASVPGPITVSAISPATGPAVGGTTVSITGSGFNTTRPVTVIIGGVPNPFRAINTTVRASNVVKVTTPVAHGYVAGDEVTIANSHNCSPTCSGTFTVTSVPSSTTFTYAQVASDSSGAGGYAEFSYQANPCTSVKVVSSTLITCLTGKTTLGIRKYNVTVIQDSRFATLRRAYTYN